ncbi:type II toxin-antitoxin system HicB family antitoxin [Trinickia violacea]|uniref:Type II toxin-antitoxin system HicB family antitoxin n=1 Tax=Trinickia violacea TaxID=2571746 RepID=A0A4P8J119_9BURK|nr:type II toxin-antitoxin system HicB family antitoxin [Trinickia violacea]QCP54651.1 type II toxin-antitoxin system HicB family antitoxin [Trinickia violacea]
MNMNILTIANHRAVVTYDPETDMLRGEFLGLNGGADFYASDIATLKAEGARSLAAFLEVCKENGIDPIRHFSGRFNARINPELHARAVEAAAAEGISLNQLIERAIEHEVTT